MESIFWAFEQNFKNWKKPIIEYYVQSLDDNSWMRFMSNPKFAMMVLHIIIFVVVNLVCVHLKKLGKHVKVSKLFKMAQMSHSLYIDLLHSGTVEKMHILLYPHIYLHKHKRIQVTNTKHQKTVSVPHIWHFHHLWTNLQKKNTSRVARCLGGTLPSAIKA